MQILGENLRKSNILCQKLWYFNYILKRKIHILQIWCKDTDFSCYAKRRDIINMPLSL